MIQHGLEPIKRRKTNYSHTRTFGTVTDTGQFPVEYNADAGFSVPDQNADGYPNGCRGYTQNELCQDQDRVPYKSSFLNEKTRLAEGTDQVEAGPIYTSLEVACTYGLQRDIEQTDADALKHKRGRYFDVDKAPGFDWFDTFRSTLWIGRIAGISISFGSPWFPELQRPAGGVVREIDVVRGGSHPWDVYAGHNWKICGWKTISGEPYLIGKPWCGKDYGDGGFLYLSREAFNRLMIVPGVGGFTVRKWDGTIATVRWGMIYNIRLQLRFYAQIIGKTVGSLLRV